MTNKTLEAIKFNKENVLLQILNQLLLPYSTEYIPIRSIGDAFTAIKSMQVRGAPAIAIVGAFAIVVDVHVNLSKSPKRTTHDLVNSIDYLISSRPTAVNLANALNQIKQLILKGSSEIVDKELFDDIFNYAVKLHEDDLSNNFKIGDNGVKFIQETLKKQNFKGPFSIITICNTGSLATSGHGTALGIIRSSYQQLTRENSSDFWFEKAYPLETRPYNQGAKLTTYELDFEKIPFTLLCDSMVTSLISSLHKKINIKGSDAPVKFIVVGADRVVRNGDTANKIGTFQLAAIANHFNKNLFKEDKEKISFIVAAPNTTIDHETVSGEDIVIEERPPHELTSLNGPTLNSDGKIGDKLTVGIATPGIEVWNPAFDVAPNELIDVIVTEDKIHQKIDGKFEI